ncbi:hypothetical protein Clacol_008314 [Clathrus columnatus]|uniref:Protein kinase domain-containing protein n=1 Tax=Clathrus columnatus TaxID=1419009 RepID=A0AAV5AHD4_9AGAM|nr:hypothetical protein Clacol_008314 [Clathrus columnatus]
MPRTTKTVFSTFKHPRPAPPPPTTRLGDIRHVKSEASLLQAHGLAIAPDGGFIFDINGVFVPPKRHLSNFIRCGYVGLQRDKLKSWAWTRKKWLVLLDGYLCAAPKEDAQYTETLPLNQVNELIRVDSKRYCCALYTPTDTWFLNFNDQLVLEAWMNDLKTQCPLLNIGNPTQTRHLLHVTYDQEAGQIKGLPQPWIETMSEMGLCTNGHAHESRNQNEINGLQVHTPLTEPSRSPVTPTSETSEQSMTRPQMTARSMPIVRQRSLATSHAPRHHNGRARGPTSSSSISALPSLNDQFKNLEARDLTGAVETVHLLPVARGENCDTWKGKWTGSFGTRQVAIHTIRFTRTVTDKSLLRKFSSIILRELKALHQLRHPNVIRVRGYSFDHGPLPAVILTWVQGGNLLDYLEYNRPVEIGQRLKFLTEAATGLAYLHKFSWPIIHGGFRAAKIFINEDGEACIAGFGLNPLLADEDARWLLEAPSPRWAAIEVVLNGRREMTSASDVFSFGRTVIEVLDGREPYYHVTDDAEVVRLVQECIPPKRPSLTGLENFPTPVEHSLDAVPPESEIRQLYPRNIFPNPQSVQLPWGKTTFWLLGPEGGPKVSLIHGISIPAYSWHLLAPSLAKHGFRVLVYDLYGRGYSEALGDPNTPYDTTLYITQLALLLQYLKFEAADIVGYSMGGGIAAAFAATFPNLVKEKVVFVASAGLGEASMILFFVLV